MTVSADRSTGHLPRTLADSYEIAFDCQHGQGWCYTAKQLDRAADIIFAAATGDPYAEMAVRDELKSRTEK